MTQLYQNVVRGFCVLLVFYLFAAGTHVGIEILLYDLWGVGVPPWLQTRLSDLPLLIQIHYKVGAVIAFWVASGVVFAAAFLLHLAARGLLWIVRCAFCGFDSNNN